MDDLGKAKIFRGHFLWKLLDDVVDQNESVKQERGRSKIQAVGEPTQDRETC